MFHGSLHLAVFGVGIFCNLFLFLRCFAKNRWKLLGPLKYNIVVQAILGILCISSHSFIIIATIGKYHGFLWCRIFPTFIVTLVSMAVFNLTALVILKQLQVLSEWKITHKTVLFSLCGVLACSTLVLLPAFASPLSQGVPIFECEGCLCQLEAVPEAEKNSDVDIRLYASWFLTLQFIAPAAVIVNRLLVLVVHFTIKEGNKDVSVNSGIHRAWFGIINTLTFVFTVFAAFAVFTRHQGAIPDDCMGSINTLFHVMELFSVIVLCFPIYLLDLLEIELENGKESKSYVVLQDDDDVKCILPDEASGTMNIVLQV